MIKISINLATVFSILAISIHTQKVNADEPNPAVTRAPAGPSSNSILLRGALLSSPENYPKIGTVAAIAELLGRLEDTPAAREYLKKFASESFADDEHYIGRHIELNAHYQKRWENMIEGVGDATGQNIPVAGAPIALGAALAKNLTLQKLAADGEAERKAFNLSSDEQIAQSVLDAHSIAESFQKNCEAKPDLCKAVTGAFISNLGYAGLAPVRENEERIPGVLLSNRVEAILKEMPELKQELGVLSLMLDGELRSFSSQLDTYNGNLESLAVAFSNFTKKVEVKIAATSNAKILAKLMQEDRDRRDQYVQSLERIAVTNGAYLLGGIARSIHKENGAVFEGVLRAGLSVREAIKGFELSMSKNLTASFSGGRAGQVLFSSVNLVAGIAQATEMLLGLLFGSNPNAAVMKMLEGISRQISQMHERMEIRFDQIDLRLNTFIKTVMATFEIISAQNQAILRDTTFIRGQIEGIRNALVQLGHLTRVYEQASANRTWALEKSVCVTPEGGLLSRNDFISCLKLFSSAVDFSSDALSTDQRTELPALDRKQQFGQLLKEVSTTGPSWLDVVRGDTIWDLINPVSVLSGFSWAHVREHQAGSSLLSEDGANPDRLNMDNLFYIAGRRGMIPNVVLLRSQVMELKQVLNENRPLIQELDYTDKRFVESVVGKYQGKLAATQNIISDLVKLKRQDYTDPRSFLFTTVQAVAKRYREAFEVGYKNFIAKSRDQFSKTETNGMNLLKPLENQEFKENPPIARSFESISHCDDSTKPTIRSGYSLSITHDQKGDLGVEKNTYMLMKAGDQAGRLQVCYTNQIWTDRTERYQFVDVGRVFGRLNLLLSELRLSIQEKDGKEIYVPWRGDRNIDGQRVWNILSKLGKRHAEHKGKGDSFLVDANDLLEMEWAFQTMGDKNPLDRIDLKFMYLFGRPGLEIEVRYYPQDESLVSKDKPYILVAKEVVASRDEEQFGIAAIGFRNFGRDIGKKLPELPMKVARRRTYFYDENFMADISDGEGVRRAGAFGSHEEKYRTNVLSFLVEKNWDKIQLPTIRTNRLDTESRTVASSEMGEFGNRWLGKKREAFNLKMAASLITLESPEEKELMLQFETLRAVLSLAFPESIENSDQLRSLLYGALGVPNPFQLAMAVKECNVPLDAGFEELGYGLRIGQIRQKAEGDAKNSSIMCKLLVQEQPESAGLVDDAPFPTHGKVYTARFDALDKWLALATAAGSKVENYPLIAKSMADLEGMRADGLSRAITHEEIGDTILKIHQAAERILYRGKPVYTDSP